MSSAPGKGSFRAVALGGGHGLRASLAALRRLTDDLTAVVTVADDGGSSGRIRRELPVLPPGDLRMALAALAGDEPRHRYWADLLQHRIGGSGVLSGHPVGNLMLTGMLEQGDDPLDALARLGELVGAVGRVLPMSESPLDIVALADRFDPDDPHRVREIRGQSSVAATPGRVRSVRLGDPDAPACAAAVAAVRDCDVVVLGPGSWFTSVIPHLLVRELGAALAHTRAKVLVVLNLVPQAGETDDYDATDLLRVLLEHAEPYGGLRLEAVLADAGAAVDVKELTGFVNAIGARLVVSDLAADDHVDRHDARRLSETIAAVLEQPAPRAGSQNREGVDAWR